MVKNMDNNLETGMCRSLWRLYQLPSILELPSGLFRVDMGVSLVVWA